MLEHALATRHAPAPAIVAFRELLVPLDGSPAAERAHCLARRIAERSGARVTLVHVHEGGPDREVIPLREYSWREAERRADESDYLWRAACAAPARARTALLADGDVACALLGFAREAESDLIVLARHGTGGASNAWLGSVADRILRFATAPVLLLPSEPGEAGEGETAFRRVLVALDGSAEADSVLEPLLALAAPDEPKVLLLRVVAPPALDRHPGAGPTLDTGEFERRLRAATDHLDAVAARLQAAGVPAAGRVLVHASPAVAILEQASAHHVDLVALTVSGAHHSAPPLLGTVADKLIRGTTTPVLALRPPAGAR
ncbi:MAG TPA: universal stress protein [Longimicrobiales bacterium]|nr:universal stress protein [Longimicrobiales bacterium]